MYNAQVFYIDSLFCKRGAHYKQEQYVSLFFFQTVKSHVYWIYVILENISLCKKGVAFEERWITAYKPTYANASECGRSWVRAPVRSNQKLKICM